MSNAPAPSSPHPTPQEWLDKATRRLNEPGGFVYPNDLTLIADLSLDRQEVVDPLRVSPLPGQIDPLREVAWRIADGDLSAACALGCLIGSALGKGERLRHG